MFILLKNNFAQKYINSIKKKIKNLLSYIPSIHIQKLPI